MLSLWRQADGISEHATPLNYRAFIKFLTSSSLSSKKKPLSDQCGRSVLSLSAGALLLAFFDDPITQSTAAPGRPAQRIDGDRLI